MINQAEIERSIVNTAMVLAEEKGWESVRLHQVAAALQLPLDEIRLHFREKEELIDAWFDRADEAMLQARETEGFARGGTREKLHLLMMQWLGALQPHRRVTRQMIAGKLEPGHIHYQVQGLLRVSRTVQWLREAAGISSTLPWRALEEAALTSIYLAAFTKWMFDDGAESRSTSRFIQQSLDAACRLYPCKKHDAGSIAENHST
ncbi:MAG: TetR/AcrR family transcriptional regulator [Pseudomonadota bacterium]